MSQGQILRTVPQQIGYLRRRLLIRDEDSFLPDRDCNFALFQDNEALAAVSLRPMLWVHSLNVAPGTPHRIAERSVRRLLDHISGWAQCAAEQEGGLRPAGAIFQTHLDNDTMRRVLEEFGATLTDPAPHTTYHFNL